jgi:hypothetical protein
MNDLPVIHYIQLRIKFVNCAKFVIISIISLVLFVLGIFKFTGTARISFNFILLPHHGIGVAETKAALYIKSGTVRLGTFALRLLFSISTGGGNRPFDIISPADRNRNRQNQTTKTDTRGGQKERPGSQLGSFHVKEPTGADCRRNSLPIE